MKINRRTIPLAILDPNQEVLSLDLTSAGLSNDAILAKALIINEAGDRIVLSEKYDRQSDHWEELSLSLAREAHNYTVVYSSKSELRIVLSENLISAMSLVDEMEDYIRLNKTL